MKDEANQTRKPYVEPTLERHDTLPEVTGFSGLL